MVFLFSILLALLSFQIQAQENSDRLTNSGEEFRDPFADPGSVETPAAIDQPEAGTEEMTEDGVEELSEEAPPTDTSVDAPPVGEPVESPSVPAVNPSEEAPAVEDKVDDFKLPEAEGFKGPVDQDVFRQKTFDQSRRSKHWYLMAEPLGVAFNLQRRKNQYHGEIEGGYRFSERFELSGVLYARFYKDRMLGFLAMPYYILPIGNQSLQKNEMRFGLGTGWTLLGIRDYDYQIGYLPIRVAANHLYYIRPRLAFSTGIDFEAYLYSIDTDGNSESLIGADEGTPLQFNLTFGFRWDF